jgi:hypothetical protein
MLAGMTLCAMATIVQADPVGAARAGFYKSLRAHADGGVGISRVEDSYARLQQAKRDRDAREKAETSPSKTGPSATEVRTNTVPYRQPSPSLEYGRGLMNFSPEANFSDQVGEVETAPIEYRNGVEDIEVRKIPGLKKYGNITLKRGTTNSSELSDYSRLSGFSGRRSD